MDAAMRHVMISTLLYYRNDHIIIRKEWALYVGVAMRESRVHSGIGSTKGQLVSLSIYCLGMT